MNNKYYVYVHETMSGEVFYVGKGTGDRAWRKGRDLNWDLYVERHLRNEYKVRIVLENLSENQALIEEETLMARYGDKLVNRQNMSRGLDIEALNTRNKIEDQRKNAELSAELSDNPNDKADYFIKALGLHKQSANTVFENGLLGKLLAERPIGNINLLDKTIRSLVSANRKDQAKFILDQYFLDYPQDKNLTKVTSIEKVIARGTVKITEQQEFIPPSPLPTGWVYAKERNEQVLRLDYKMYETDKTIRYNLDTLKDLVDQDLGISLNYIKQWIVQDEMVNRKDPMNNALWLYAEARKIASKQKNLLEECLFQQRFTNLLKGRNNHYEKNLVLLRKMAAKLAKQK